MLIFWSSDSPHSLLWLRDFRSSWEALPKRSSPRGYGQPLMKAEQPSTAAFENFAQIGRRISDGLGWRGAIPRSLGINALPAVWMIDKRGILRSINARANYENLISPASQREFSFLKRAVADRLRRASAHRSPDET